jgi:predicted AAA+ superfamily ATPase
MMLAHYHGQTLNYSELSRSFGVSDATIRHYLDILSGAFVIRLLPPWFENAGKRQVRAPKLYIRDSGLLHALLGIDSEDALQVNPKLGASWEGFALEQILSVYRIESEEAYFWGVHAQGELDLLMVRGGQRVGFEIKYTDRPQATRKHREFIELLGLERLEIVCPGSMEHWLEPKIVVRGLDRLCQGLVNRHADH